MEKAESLIKGIADEAAPKEIYDMLCKYLERSLKTNHQRIIFLSDFLEQLDSAINDKQTWHIIRLQYAKTIEKAANELKKLRVGNSIYDNDTKERAGTDKPENEGVSIDKIINLAIKPLRKKNRKRAKDFMELYAKMRDTYPQYNPTDFVDEIDWIEPTPNTQKDWMEKFDKAEKTLSISN